MLLCACSLKKSSNHGGKCMPIEDFSLLSEIKVTGVNETVTVSTGNSQITVSPHVQ